MGDVTSAMPEIASMDQVSVRPRPRNGWWVGLALGAVAGVVSYAVFRRGFTAQEDAAILFRYSENLANGAGIVYNPGGPTVDGATDMPFMAAIASLRLIGLSTEAAATVLNAVAVGMIASLVYIAWVRWARAGRWWALAPVVVLALGPVWAFGTAGFGAPVFAALAAAVAFGGERAIDAPTRSRLIVLGALVAALGLARPEGFYLGGLIVVACAVLARDRRFVLIPLAVVVPVVIAWVAWRWSYFGYPLPNPFYKKGGGSLYPASLAVSLRNVLGQTVILLLLPIAGLFVSKARRRALVLLGVVFAWAAVWLLLSNEMNYFGRFQYAVVPALAVQAARLVPDLAPSVPQVRRRTRVGAVVAIAFLLAAVMAATFQSNVRPVAAQVVKGGEGATPGIHRSLALTLAPYAGEGPRDLASTEAGYVAWRSGWKVTDLWGLNDKRIAHEGYLSEEQLSGLAADVVFAHLCYPTGLTTPDSDYPCIPGWNKMADPLVCHMKDANYELAGYWVESPSHAWTVWVNPLAPDADQLVRTIASTDVGQSRLGTPMPNRASEAEIPRPRGCSGAAA